jgi:putative ABC transport system permease protein
MTLQLSLAWRYLNGRRLRTFLTTLAVLFGILVIFTMNTILPSMTKALMANVQAGEGISDFTVTHATGGSFYADALPAMEKIEGVRAVSPSLNRTVNLPPDYYDKNPARPDVVKALSLCGVDPETVRALRSYPMEAGRFLEPTDGAAAVISQTLADVLNVRLGESFPIPSVNGVVELAVVGIRPARLSAGNEEVLVTLPQAQLMAGEAGRINTIDIGIDNPTAGEKQRAEIQKRIQAVLGDDFRVGAVISGSEAFASMKLAKLPMDLFGVLALFMGGFIIFNTFRTVVTERRRDIGMLRAVGASRRIVVGMILVEGLLQGLLGSAAGLVLGYLLAAGAVGLANPVLGRYVNLKMGAPVVSPLLVLGCLAIGVGTTVFAALLPALRARDMTPLEAMKPAAAESRFARRAGVRFAIGAAVLGSAMAGLLSGNTNLVVPGALLFLSALVLVGPALVSPLAGFFGRIIAFVAARDGTGDIASGNIRRQPSRVAVTASSTMLGLAVIVAAGGLISSLRAPIQEMLRKSLGSEYLFMPPAVTVWNGDMGAGPQFAESLRAIDGVGDVSSIRFAGSTVEGQAVSVLGIDPVEFPKVSGLFFLQGNDSAYKRLSEGRTLIANPVFLSVTGAKVGGTATLLTPGGPAEYRVIALATEALNMKAAAVFISQEAMAKDFGRAEDVLIQLNLKSGADAPAADANIKAVAGNYPQFQLVRGLAYYRSIMGQMNAAFAAIYILFAFLALPSLIATINTLTIGVIERTKEIGMIRAVGATQRQIRSMVLAEALLLAAIGTVFGLLAGLYLGRTLVSALKDMLPLGYSFPASGMLAAVLFGVLFGALSAVVPARQAARLRIVEALRYE